MSYWDQAVIANDSDINQRVTACAVSEGVPDAIEWAQSHRWQLATQPGWDTKWATYMQNQEGNGEGGGGGLGAPASPGAHPGVITDADILSAVQALRDAGV